MDPSLPHGGGPPPRSVTSSCRAGSGVGHGPQRDRAPAARRADHRSGRGTPGHDRPGRPPARCLPARCGGHRHGPASSPRPRGRTEFTADPGVRRARRWRHRRRARAPPPATLTPIGSGRRDPAAGSPHRGTRLTALGAPRLLPGGERCPDVLGPLRRGRLAAAVIGSPQVARRPLFFGQRCGRSGPRARRRIVIGFDAAVADELGRIAFAEPTVLVQPVGIPEPSLRRRFDHGWNSTYETWWRPDRRVPVTPGSGRRSPSQGRPGRRPNPTSPHPGPGARRRCRRRSPPRRADRGRRPSSR